MPARPKNDGTSAKATRNRRGSPDVVSKRRAARAFNELLGGASSSSKLDGRTEKRRQRLLDELKEGQARASKKGLKPIDVLTRIDALLSLGESLAAIKKVCRPPKPVAASAEVVAGVKRLHEAYKFPPEVYAFVGIDDATLRRAGVLGRGVGLADTKPGSPRMRKAAESGGSARAA
jgi:hypothetical protein